MPTGTSYRTGTFTGALRIRNRKDPHQIERKYPDPYQSDKLDPDPHQFVDDKPKCMEPIWALFQGFEPLFGS